MDRFDCDDIGEVKEYVGCKIDRDVKDNVFKFTQPVMIQSFRDEFELGKECAKTPVTPTDPGTVLVKAEDKDKVGQKRQTYYRSGVGKLLHMARWSRPDVQNAVRDVSRHGSAPVEAHVKAMHRIVEFVERTKDRGWKLKPNRRWNGFDRTFKFKIKGKSDSDFANSSDTRRSVSGWAVYLKGAPVACKSIMQKIVALSVTEAELVAAVMCVQHILYVMRLLESMKILVEYPMVIEIDNIGAVDLANNWSVGGRKKHMQTRMFFLRDLKEEGILKVVWKEDSNNKVDTSAKNLAGSDFSKRSNDFVSRVDSE